VFAFELDQPADGLERFEVSLAVERGEHAGVVADRGDRGADAAAERFAAGSAPEVVVASGAGWFGDELQVARAGPQLEYRLSAQVPVKLEWLARS
jgi:hypothetical protein